MIDVPIIWDQDYQQYIDVKLSTLRLRNDPWDTQTEETKYFATFERGERSQEYLKG